MHLSRCRGRERHAASEDCGGSSSVSFLTRHIQSLKKRVRRFEEQFEEEMKYKVLHKELTEVSLSKNQLAKRHSVLFRPNFSHRESVHF